MFHFLIKHLRGWFKRSEKIDETPVVNEAPTFIDQNNEVPPPGFGHILITVCNDGDFTVATDISETTEECAEVTGMILHMINSGLMANIFLQSLNLWAETPKQKVFMAQVIESWKGLYDEESSDKSKNTTNNLAVDPSDVFGLKSLKE